MARKRYTEEQIIAVLNEAAEAGAKTGELCCRHGMSEGAFYKWKCQVRWADAERVEEAEVP